MAKNYMTFIKKACTHGINWDFLGFHETGMYTLRACKFSVSWELIQGTPIL